MHFFRIKTSLIIAGTAVACFFGGCAKAPDAKLAEAKSALQAAKDAEADKYITSNYENMTKAIANAEEEIAVQKKGFILTRKYKRINEMLDKTIAYCKDLAEKAPQTKATIAGEVKENLGLVDGMLKETANDITKAARKRKRKEKALFEELDGDLAKAKSMAADARTKFDSGNILEARSDLGEVQGLMKKITDSLNPPKQQ